MILPFDKIVVLSLVETPERLENFWKEIKKLNIENKIEVWHACKHPFQFELCWNLKNEHNYIWNSEGNGSAFNCTREHYNIVKYALYSSCESLLVFEDDMQFKNDIENIINILNKPLPNDWNLIQYGYYPGYSNTYNKELGPYNLITDNIQNWGTPMYALSKKGMEYYIKFQDNQYSVADYPLFCASLQLSGTYHCYPTLYCETIYIPSTIQ